MSGNRRDVESRMKTITVFMPTGNGSRGVEGSLGRANIFIKFFNRFETMALLFRHQVHGSPYAALQPQSFFEGPTHPSYGLQATPPSTPHVTYSVSSQLPM